MIEFDFVCSGLWGSSSPRIDRLRIDATAGARNTVKIREGRINHGGRGDAAQMNPSLRLIRRRTVHPYAIENQMIGGRNILILRDNQLPQVLFGQRPSDLKPDKPI